MSIICPPEGPLDTSSSSSSAPSKSIGVGIDLGRPRKLAKASPAIACFQKLTSEYYLATFLQWHSSGASRRTHHISAHSSAKQSTGPTPVPIKEDGIRHG